MFGWLSKLLKPKPKVNPSAWVPPEYSEEELEACLDSTPKIDIHWGEEVAVSNPESFNIRYGGLPYGCPQELWPILPMGGPMTFIAQCPLQEPVVLSQSFQMAYVFMAQTYGTNSECEFETWDPATKNTKVVLVSEPTHSFAYGPQVEYSREIKLNRGWQFDIPCGDDRPNWIYELNEYQDEMDHERGSFQLGGYAPWWQENAHPKGSDGIPMNFLFSLDSKEYQLGDFISDGAMYVFECIANPEESCLVWQCT